MTRVGICLSYLFLLMSKMNKAKNNLGFNILEIQHRENHG